MPDRERTESAEIEHSLDTAAFAREAEIYGFPTTPEIAARGMVKFTQGMDQLSDHVRDKLMADKHHLLQAIFGWDCHVGFEAPPKRRGERQAGLERDQKDLWTRGEVRELKAAFDGDVFFLRPEMLKHVDRPWELAFNWINLAGAARVIGRYPEVYPRRAARDPAAWVSRWRLRDEQNKRTYNERLGLLSGFPMSAVQRYNTRNDLIDRNSAGWREWRDFSDHFKFGLTPDETWNETRIAAVREGFLAVAENDWERHVAREMVDFTVYRLPEWQVAGVEPEAVMFSDEDYRFWERRAHWQRELEMHYGERLAKRGT